ncbi:hypothetical protein [Shewanella maritima]|uniref:hypothetical protein n=1 Tax=Shewanella maritima TaxID=2520507 RepID=UPI00373560BA
MSSPTKSSHQVQVETENAQSRASSASTQIKHNEYTATGATQTPNKSLRQRKAEIREASEQKRYSVGTTPTVTDTHQNQQQTQPLDDVEQLILHQEIEEQEEKQNVRRDHITRLAIQGFDFINSNQLSKKLAIQHKCSVQQIQDDLQQLTDPKVWKKHKLRLKHSIQQQQLRKEKLKQHRKSQVSDFMNQSVVFSTDLLITMAKQFECQPRNIVEDMMHYKTFDNLHKTFKQANSKMPAIRAITRYTKLNLRY